MRGPRRPESVSIQTRINTHASVVLATFGVKEIDSSVGFLYEEVFLDGGAMLRMPSVTCTARDEISHRPDVIDSSINRYSNK